MSCHRDFVGTAKIKLPLIIVFLLVSLICVAMSLPEDFEFEPEVKNIVRTARKAGNLELVSPIKIMRLAHIF